MKVAVVFDTLHPDWEDADYKKEVDAKVEEAEYDVARALMALAHDVLMVGVAEQLAPVLERLPAFPPTPLFTHPRAVPRPGAPRVRVRHGARDARISLHRLVAHGVARRPEQVAPQEDPGPPRRPRAGIRRIRAR